MNTGFDYKYFSFLLNIVRQYFSTSILSDMPKVVNNMSKRTLFLRHDLDISLKKAIRMAEIEHNYSIKASYMVMNNSPLYSLNTDESKKILASLIAMGHEIGVHFNVHDFEKISEYSLTNLENEIEKACKQVEKAIGRHIKSLSFHRPLPELLNGPLLVRGRVNAYAKELFSAYISDSKGRWQEGEPLKSLLNNVLNPVQLLIHPIWWNDTSNTAKVNLDKFFGYETTGKTEKFKEKFRQALALTVPSVHWR